LTTVLKLGGELLEDADAVRRAAAGIQSLLSHGPLVVVHGGGRAIDADLRARGTSPRFVDGLRVTDENTLGTVVSVLAGRINTAFVAALVSTGVRAVGLTGADAGLGRSDRVPAFTSATGSSVDLGLVGVPQPMAPSALIADLLSLGYVPVIASIGITSEGALLNVNADVLASHLSRSIEADRLIVAGSTPGVFDGAGAPCATLDQVRAEAMVAAGTARDGMVAKLRAGLDALDEAFADGRIVGGLVGGVVHFPGTTITRSPDFEMTR
jgi:acetylglutamate kinase